MQIVIDSTAWQRSQTKEFAKHIRDRYGKAWDYFVPEIKEAVVAQQVMVIVLGQDLPDVGNLYADVCKEMGLEL